MTVADHFAIERVGLLVTPSFPAPRKGWRNLSEQVTVIRPSGEEVELTANFNSMHLNIPDPNDVRARWQIVVCFPSGTKEQIPIGSKILVSTTIKAAIAGEPKDGRAADA